MDTGTSLRLAIKSDTATDLWGDVSIGFDLFLEVLALPDRKYPN
jgi:hypothetical protein